MSFQMFRTTLSINSSKGLLKTAVPGEFREVDGEAWWTIPTWPWMLTYRCQVARLSLAFSSLMESMASWHSEVQIFPVFLCVWTFFIVFSGVGTWNNQKTPGKLQEKLGPCRIATSIASSATRQLVPPADPSLINKARFAKSFWGYGYPGYPPFFQVASDPTVRASSKKENLSSHSGLFKLFMRMENYTLHLWNHQNSAFSKLQKPPPFPSNKTSVLQHLHLFCIHGCHWRATWTTKKTSNRCHD